MKNILKVIVLMILSSQLLKAGNPERAGQAGATQLLINPWARNSGVHGINTSNAYGIESVINNPAGLARTKRTELVFSHTRYLVGTDINLNTFGFSQGLKKGGVLGLSVVSFDLGEFERTTIDQPDGTLGTFRPTFLNIGVSYAKTFVDDRIYVGFTTRIIHESITDVAANGVAFDAGVQYTDKGGKFRIGVSLKNVGPEMRYSGDGLTQRADLGGANSRFTSNVSTVASKFELPTQLNIGASYEFNFGGDSLASIHTILPMINFTANAFSRDQIGGGAEYRFKKYFMFRAAYVWEKGITNPEQRMNVYTGLAFGATVEIPFKSGDGRYSSFGFDYSYRTTNPFQGTHSLGCRVNL